MVIFFMDTYYQQPRRRHCGKCYNDTKELRNDDTLALSYVKMCIRRRKKRKKETARWPSLRQKTKQEQVNMLIKYHHPTSTGPSSVYRNHVHRVYFIRGRLYLVQQSTPRCQPRGKLISEGCEDKFIDDLPSMMSIIQNQNVTDSNHQNDAVQIQPQLVSITTRPKKTHRISMTFRAANNYPVDLYFLFDNSRNMEAHLKNLANLASDIAQSISSISSNFLMGYGVFLDKVILPFTETKAEKLKNPCISYNLICAPPFEFIHLLNMTNHTVEFREKVSRTMVSANLDHPEGSLEAIIQAVTCKSEIGWRSASHKFLIFASNGRFHLAGDGRIGGIVIPNDGQCHLDTNGRYTMGIYQDYPSVSQLTDIIAKGEVHVIFAVTSDQVSLFKELASRIPTSRVELLASPDDPGNGNIKEIFETEYKEMLSEVEIVHNQVSGIDIQISATSEHCQGKETNKCKSVNNLGLLGTPIEFEMNVTVTQCPRSPEERMKRVIVYSSTMKSEQLVLEIDTQCECSCKTDMTKWELNSETCTKGNGTLKCGLCDCHHGRSGQFCECDPTNTDTSVSGCVRAGENSTTLCSNAGVCECGLCKCDEGYSGPYCECYDRSCGHYRREVCGGARGHCVCGECVCEPEYTGTKCECPTSNVSCIYDETVCNDAGICECGACKCQKGYIGAHCENCFLCDDTVCDNISYHDCAECTISEKTDECPDSCPEMKVINNLENNGGLHICSVAQTDGCFLPFQIITSDNNNITILVKKTATCPEKFYAVVVSAGVFGGVVSLGVLLLLLWKILISIYDKIEYSKFQEDMRKCKWEQQDSPFYKGAITTYRNPLLDTNDAATY